MDQTWIENDRHEDDLDKFLALKEITAANAFGIKREGVGGVKSSGN
jgi:hypothetical protein